VYKVPRVVDPQRKGLVMITNIGRQIKREAWDQAQVVTRGEYSWRIFKP
jgi:hypothetical protein